MATVLSGIKHLLLSDSHNGGVDLVLRAWWYSMSRGVKDLRELVVVSRLTYRWILCILITVMRDSFLTIQYNTKYWMFIMATFKSTRYNDVPKSNFSYSIQLRETFFWLEAFWDINSFWLCTSGVRYVEEWELHNFIWIIVKAWNKQLCRFWTWRWDL